MKKLFFFLALILLCSQITSAKVIFVKQNAIGDGSSWTSAFGQLQSALEIAEKGDQIWVATGTYYTSNATEVSDETRSISFVIKDGVALYGGFFGNETILEDRDSKFNLTTLSGEMGDIDSNEDNAFTVITTIDVSSETIIDGFTITKGNANGFGAAGDPTSCGGAWFNMANINTESSPTILNCTFTNNGARDGGAMYNFANEGVIRTILTDCKFLSNHTDFDGGALYNNGDNSICSPIIKSCYFVENDSYYGAGILNKGVKGETKPLITGCVFAGNVSTVRGGAIYSYDEDKGICEAIISGCRFEDNPSLIKDEMSGVRVADNKPTIVIRATTPNVTPEEITSFDE